MNLNKYIPVGIVIGITITACSANQPKGTISGKIDGAQGKTIYLESFINNRSVRTDSTVAGADGSFVLAPSRNLELNFYRLLVDDEFVTLITDSTESPEITANLEDFTKSLHLSGSLESETLHELELKSEPFDNKDVELKKKMTAPGITPEEKNMLNQELITNRKARTDYIKSWLETHSTSPAALLAIQHLDPRTDMVLFNRVFADLEKPMGHSILYKGIKQQVQMFISKDKGADQGGAPSASNIAPGKPAPEIALSDPKGKTRKLSDLKGKTVLIDFWASWCGPCRRENPNVVKAYQKYNKDGFEVFSVSLDKAKDPWLKAIADDGLIWPNHVSDLKWWDSEAADLYGVRSIPFTVLVDKDGNIIGHNFRGSMLEEKLKAIYGH
ncbi:MAG: AhpC/TSA family protein [Flavobacteriales bacterium]|nr:AhpC/TSA family protein [Flavobacteriales bacterium]